MPGFSRRQRSNTGSRKPLVEFFFDQRKASRRVHGGGGLQFGDELRFLRPAQAVRGIGDKLQTVRGMGVGKGGHGKPLRRQASVRAAISGHGADPWAGEGAFRAKPLTISTTISAVVFGSREDRAMSGRAVSSS